MTTRDCIIRFLGFNRYATKAHLEVVVNEHATDGVRFSTEFYALLEENIIDGAGELNGFELTFEYRSTSQWATDADRLRLAEMKIAQHCFERDNALREVANLKKERDACHAHIDTARAFRKAIIDVVERANELSKAKIIDALMAVINENE